MTFCVSFDIPVHRRNIESYILLEIPLGADLCLSTSLLSLIPISYLPPFPLEMMKGASWKNYLPR